MNETQFLSAQKLRDEARKISREIEIWEKELTRPEKLGYLQGWNNNHATKLETSVPSTVFDWFRASAMDALRARLAAIEKEFSEL